MDDLRLAFVSAPDGSAFMTEILAAIADAVRQFGVKTVAHSGYAEEVDDGRTAVVLVPHEYFVLNQPPSKSVLHRTIAFGVEHPGTDTFSVSAEASSRAAARFEISLESVAAMATLGHPAEHFQLGYTQAWDRWKRADVERPVDLVYLGTADPGRLGTLARLAPELCDVQTELLIPPHEQMTKERPDFLIGQAKWELLARSRLMLNLHRENKTALEWVRTLEAMCNGCVVLSESSTDLGPLVPGEHLLLASRARLGAAVRAALADSPRLAHIAETAYTFCQSELSMDGSAARLIAVAEELVRHSSSRSGDRDQVQHVNRAPRQTHMAVWAPEAATLPNPDQPTDQATRRNARILAALRRRHVHFEERLVSERQPADIDVICVDHLGAGPLSLTADGLREQRLATNLHVGGVGRTQVPKVGDLASYVTAAREVALGAVRNRLLKLGNAEYVLIVDSGDALTPSALDRMHQALDDTPKAVVAFPMAVKGSDMLVNVFYPEAARLRRFAYLSRGYLVRRSWLNDLGGFAVDPVLETLVDHDFWLRTASRGGVSKHLRHIGVRLWPTDQSLMALADPTEAAALLARRAA